MRKKVAVIVNGFEINFASSMSEFTGNILWIVKNLQHKVKL